MSPSEKKQLTDHLSSLDRNERAKLAKQAAHLRKLEVSRKPARAKSQSFDEDDEGPVRHSPLPAKRPKSIDDYMWQIVSSERPKQSEGGSGVCVQVLSVLKNGFEVYFEGEKLLARPRNQKLEAVSVGDQILVEKVESDLFATKLMPRRTWLSRPDVHNPHIQRVIAANLDVVVVVVSVVSPPLHPRLIDRYLLAIQSGGCEAMLVVNKLDLASSDVRIEELAKLTPYRDLKLPIFECIARTGEGVANLRASLNGKTAAFVGHSGVGKSSVVNAFDPRLSQDVGAVSENYGRGTHTTTRSSLIDLGDLKVIDTPGIRSFGLWNIDSEDLKRLFPEFVESPRCRFSDCNHVREPGCGVKDAVQSGQISSARYDAYLRILESL